MNDTELQNLIINKHFEDNGRVSGQHSYHSGDLPTYNSPVKGHGDEVFLGVELEVVFPNSEQRRRFVNLTSNWYKVESDGSLPDYGSEIITLPIPASLATKPAFWKHLCAALNECKAKSWKKNQCGLHVHASSFSLLTSAEYVPLCDIAATHGYYSDESTAEYEARTRIQCEKVYPQQIEARMLYANCVDSLPWANNIFGRSETYYARSVKNSVTKAMEALGVEEITDSMKRQYKDNWGCADHKDAFNISKRWTCEFRQGKGSISPERIASVCQLAACFMKFCQRKLSKRKLVIKRDEFKEYLIKHTPKSHPLHTLAKFNEEE